MLVSSRNDPKLAMNGTCWRNSRAFQPGGAEYARFASHRIKIFGGGLSRDCPRNSSAIDRDGTGAGAGENCSPPGAFTLPSSAFSALTASGLSDAVGLRERRARDERDGGLVPRKLSCQPLDGGGPYAGRLRNQFGRMSRQPLRPTVDERAGAAGGAGRPEPGLDDGVCQAQREQPFGARRRSNPLVGAHAGERQARLDLHHLHPAATAGAHRAKSMTLGDRRVPRAEEIGAKGDHVPRGAEVHGGQLLAAEADQVRAAQHRVAKDVQLDPRRRTEPLEECRDQLGSAGAEPAGQNRQRSRIAGSNQRVDLCEQLGDRLVPGDLLILSAAARPRALHRRRQPIGMVGDLQRRLPARAEFPAADRVFGVAFELLDQPHPDDAGLAAAKHLRIALDHARHHSAPGPAKRADARLPGRDAGNQILFRNEADDLILRVPTRRQRRRRAGDGGDL